ncbi:MAG: Flagellar P-ring protein precursor [Deltaproteobacteria bacterium ADurb.Bin026]|nr:MAG: Flagellar P-ring protein precursor [Deltaproteobacteria bacterium ADurb.Bin026]
MAIGKVYVLEILGTKMKNICYKNSKLFCIILIFSVLFSLSFAQHGEAARIKELCYINGVRGNQLVGYGLVIGLQGTGDKANTIFTTQSLANMLEKMGLRVAPNATKVKNVAAVIVTADLPPFGKTGTKIDATVSSIGDSSSLSGGVLLMTPLKGADGEVYAVAQGPLVVGGISAAGQGASMQKNHTTVGRIPNGVTIEKEIGYEYIKAQSIVISLKNPDFTTARRIEERINAIYGGISYADDGGTISVKIPDRESANPVKFISAIENIDVKADMLAKIVVDEKTGTIVIGHNVRISTVAISQGNISVMVKEDQKVSQPLPFAPGAAGGIAGAQTVITPETQIRVDEEKGKFRLIEGDVTIKELVNVLNAVGVSTREMISILQTIKAAGALHAELEII